MRLTAAASESAANGFDSEIQSFLLKSFNNVAMATVATSAAQGISLGYLPPTTAVVMNANRRFHVAKTRVISLSDSGYLPPPVMTRIKVLGRPAFAAMRAGAYQYLQGRFISEYDFKLACELAYVLSGGDLTGSQEVHEDYLLELEREVFLRLLGESRTQERITHILTTNKPLRN
jgi:3-hydroxyacyl-CoA dehydrogenase